MRNRQKRFMPTGLACLLLAVLLVGTNVNGATRWINLGFTQLQPSEIAKLSLIISLSVLMTRNQKDIKSMRTFLSCAGALAIIALLLITFVPQISLFIPKALGGYTTAYTGVLSML